MTKNRCERAPGAARGLADDRPITIIYLIDQVWSGHGGTERQLLQLVAGLDQRRYRPRLLVLYDKGDFVDSAQAPPECRCLRLKSQRQRRYWTSVAALAGEIRRSGPSLLHTVFPECATLGPWLARLAKVPHVTWRRDLGYWLTPGRRQLLRWGSRWTACCVANSEAVRDRVIENERFRPEQVLVIRNTIDCEALGGIQPRDVPAALNLPPATVCVGFPANLRPVKGGQIVLQALSRARASGALLHLVSIGENSLLIDEYRQRCHELGIAQAVTFLGHLPREELLRWTAGCDMVVNASYSEGYSNSNVEAMLLSRPLIATAVGGNVEQIVNGESGILVPSGDVAAMAEAMLELYHDRQKRLQLGRAGARRVRDIHGDHRSVVQHEVLYERVLGRKRTAHGG